MRSLKRKEEKLTVSCAAPDAQSAQSRIMARGVTDTTPSENVTEMATYSCVRGVMTPPHDTDFPVHAVTAAGEGMYMRFDMPILPRNPRVKSATLTLHQQCCQGEHGDGPSVIGLYALTSDVYEGEAAPAPESNPLDIAMVHESAQSYTFDITQLMDRVMRGEGAGTSLALKYVNEATPDAEIHIFATGGLSSVTPKIEIFYESSYGTSGAYRAHSHDVGRFGRGSIDLACGNLMFECEDFSWSGARMPVSVRHSYNSALSDIEYTKNEEAKLHTADFSAMHIGLGFKLNLMQSMTGIGSLPFEFEDGEEHSGFVYIGEDGGETYFARSEKSAVSSGGDEYFLYEDTDGGDMIYDPIEKKLTSGADVYRFDDNGRLISVTDTHGNAMRISYTAERIAKVCDGADREFVFSYTDEGYLSSVTAPDGSIIRYAYTDGYLTSVTYPDSRRAVLAYTNTKLSAVVLYGSDGDIKYRVTYGYSSDRVVRVTENAREGGSYVQGAQTVYSYSAAANRTIATTTERADASEGESTANVIKTVYCFDPDGEVVSEYAYTEDTGNVGIDASGAGINPIPDNTGYSAPVVNLLFDHSFDKTDDESPWTALVGNDVHTSISRISGNRDTKHGRSALRIVTELGAGDANGISQNVEALGAGEYTFSAYVRPIKAPAGDSAGLYLRVTDDEGTVLCESEKLSTPESDYVRISASFTLAAQTTVNAQILCDGICGAYIDSAQLEASGYAGDYNMLENPSFRKDLSGWTGAGEHSTGEHSTGVTFDRAGSLLIRGDVSREKKMYQDIPVKAYADTRETFTLSGWARGNGIPAIVREELPNTEFCLFAEVHYRDGSADEPVIIPFCSAVTDWQYASGEITKSRFKSADFIRVGCSYSHNVGTAYFDGLSLVRTGIENGVSADDFAEYDGEHDSENDLADTAEQTEDTAPAFEELFDEYGNTLTETTFTDGEFGAIYRAFGYTNNGNDFSTETDARGNETGYTVDAATSRNTEITDRLGNKTAYEYDENGRTTKVTSKDSTNAELANVSYAYDSFDNMTEIMRGDGMAYVLSYNAFHNLESIGIEGKAEALVSYAYKNGNGRLKQITYANGHTMKATYNSVGQMIAERWYDSEGTLTAHYKYVYDNHGNIVRSVDITALREYNYMYENGALIRSAEYAIAVENELVTAKTLVSSVTYSYDTEGTLTKKRIKHTDGTEQVIFCETNDGNTVIKFTAGGNTVTSHSKTDSFGRKVFDELQLGTGFVSRQFAYFAGDIPEEHKTSGKVKSASTTNLVSQLILSDGRTISYEYDKEERITKVTDSVDGTCEYTYDALGQLLTETVNGIVVNSMTYDNYGNILTKNGTTYTYGNTAWKDLLTSYNGQTITYDAQGNPVNYLGHTLTWEKGRRLRSFDNIEYTYNANGIRTSKTVGGIKHEYTLDGTKILRETWDGNTLVPLYDNEDSVCGITYNGTPYYFLKNLQGDVIAIVDSNSNTVARYTYDAWGVCKTLTPDGTENDTVSFIGNINPYRYRSYYYDAEIGLYYLQSRYYDADVGRFVNADDERMILYNNDALTLSFYNYCLNSSINYLDASGKIAITICLSATAAAALLNMITALFFACVATVILTDPGFQRALANAIDSMGTGIKSLSDAVVKAIDSALDSAKKKRKDNRYERHHIVAQSSSNSDAVKSRGLLSKVKIGVNSTTNLVDIKYNLHRHLHTNVYYKAVYKFLKRAEGSYAKTVLVLNVIRKVLQAASSSCP